MKHITEKKGGNFSRREEKTNKLTWGKKNRVTLGGKECRDGGNSYSSSKRGRPRRNLNTVTRGRAFTS